MAAWTKADIARVQYALDWLGYLTRGVKPGKERERDAYVREYAPRFVVGNLRETSIAEGASPREKRAAARLAARVEAEGLPEGVKLPLFGEPDAPEPVAVREDSGPTPMWDHPLHARVDPTLEAAYYATLQRPRFVALRDWRRCDGSEAPTIHWHAWARETAEQLGAGKGWATLEGSSVPDDHAAVSHVQRVLVAAAETVEPPRGLVALDLRGLGLRCVRALAEELVTAARDRASTTEHLRGAVLLADHYPAMALARLVDLELEG